MDRRIKKSRAAIFQAFLTLLHQKEYEKITVRDIIEKADVGRSTFYAHFETKEALLEALCQDLFQHLFVERKKVTQTNLTEILAHTFHHFRKNQDKIATLLLSKNTYFIHRLQIELERYLLPLIKEQLLLQKTALPESFLKNYVTTTFIETVTWWLGQRKKIDEETIANYFLTVIL